jgi:oxygen-dependent protoporphyrinogen oxidase
MATATQTGTTGRVVVVGAGVAGLSAAYTLVQAHPGLDVVVLEAGDRVGGLVASERTADGCLLEWGPDAMLLAGPEVAGVTKALGLDPLAASTAVGSRVVLNGKRHPLPMGVLVPGVGSVGAVMGSPLLSWGARARLAVEGFVPARRSEEDETVEAFVARRMGRAVLDRMIGPLLHGIRGADPAAMSAHATLPQLVAMERAHGSVTAGILREALAGRKAKGAPGAGPRRGGMVSFAEGMAALPGAMAGVLGGRVWLGCAVRAVTRTKAGVRVTLASGEHLDADGVVLAVPAYVAAGLLAGVDAAAAEEAASVGYAPAVHVTMAFAAGEVDARDLPGLVVAASEGLSVRACTWSSRKFPGRAPEGVLTVRCSLTPEALEAEDGDVAAAARADLRTLTGIAVAPRWTRVVKIARAIPRYSLGHAARVTRVGDALAAESRVALAGAAWRGAGVADCVVSGAGAAAQVMAAA